MTTEQPALKSCPFCGVDDVFVERGTFGSCFVMCNNCGSRGPECDPENDADVEAEERDDLNPGEMAARRAWNRRSGSAGQWRLVPVEPTPEMWEAGMNCWSPDDSQGDYLEKAYKAMLDAAPPPPGARE